MTQTQSSGTTTEPTFTIVEPPAVLTHAQRQRRYKASDKGKQYEHDRKITNGPDGYLDRAFIGWDGEGITLEDGSHLYTLFASSVGHHLQDDSGLSTRSIFDCLIQAKIDHGDAIHVIYGGSYDFNMWFKDMSQSHINRLYESGACFWGQYRIAWRRGKSLTVTDRNTNTTITIYDVVSFFQCAFVKACDDYLGDRFIHRDMIVANKAARGKFNTDDNATVADYNHAELENLVLLMQELRLRLHRVTLRPKRWDGPGAIASALLQREKIKAAMAVCPDEVMRASRFAYFGGRFEVIRCGNVSDRKSYEYDINSAYPSALRNVPNLRDGTWSHTDSPPVSDRVFGVYRITWDNDDKNLLRPQPFPARDDKGRIWYAPHVEGWYWAPEIVAAAEYVVKYGGELIVHEGWRFDSYQETEPPFAFIDPMYLKRQALKKAKDGAHVGIKLGLNSLYGKTCQRVGWKRNPDTGALRTPPFHQLEWAGYVTSHCRSLVLRAALSDLDSVIAFETDALFTSRPLDLSIGVQLGQWEQVTFTHLTYVQSGFYFGTVDGEPFAKTRGIDRGSMTFADVESALAIPNESERVVHASLTRFIGVGLARALNDWDRWCRWETTPKQVKLNPETKRVHVDCPECDGEGLTPNRWHYTFPPVMNMISSEYPIPWINPNPNMTELDEMHELRLETDWDDEQG